MLIVIFKKVNILRPPVSESFSMIVGILEDEKCVLALNSNTMPLNICVYKDIVLMNVNNNGRRMSI